PYKKMDSPRGIASFARTAEWDSIITYTNSQRKPFDYDTSHRPSKAVVKKAMADLLENIKFKNCTINEGYLKALGVKKP
ncbi:MAG: glycoside hydrolase family 5 protein, partial [Ignavibacteria bacterium]|nr:glycoside hydrolase family 5 protein [Ignavibacteria bacterium]